MYTPLGVVSFSAIRIWAGQAVKNFNTTIQSAPNNQQSIRADTSNGFTFAFIGYLLYAIGLVASLSMVRSNAPTPIGGGDGFGQGGGYPPDNGYPPATSPGP